MDTSVKILFVDDDDNVLNGLRRMLRPMRSQWQMFFANDPFKALEMLSESKYDVIVSDMRMPGMTGAELTRIVRDKYPHMVRILLSGQASKSNILRSIGPMHQYLSKPCEPQVLISVLHRSFKLKNLLSNTKLLETVSQIEALPCLPKLYTDIVEELHQSEPSMKKIGQIVSSDIGLCSKLLQLVNSALFGVRKHISDPQQAVNLLGVDAIRMLVLTVKVFSEFDRDKIESIRIESLWQHSLNVGIFARRIAEMEGKNSGIMEDSHLGGLLHDLGKLILMDKYTEKYASMLEMAKEKNSEQIKMERDIIGASHTELGAFLMGLWGMIDPIVEAVALHHNPSEQVSAEFSVVTAVHVADVLEYKITNRLSAGPQAEMDLDYLKIIGLENRVPVWEQACRDILTNAASI